jgi:hypothetical protein
MRNDAQKHTRDAQQFTYAQPPKQSSQAKRILYNYARSYSPQRKALHN